MRYLYKSILVGSTALFGACTTTPLQYNETNLMPVLEDLMQSAPLPKGFGAEPVSIETIREMAVKRNRIYRQRVDRMMVQLENNNASIKSALPQIYAQSFGRWRNNTNASVGVRVDDQNGTMPEDFFTAQDRTYANSNITLTWNLLDVALTSHNRAGASIDGYDAIENNRAGCHQLMVDVERAFWRKAAYDRAKGKREWLNSRVEYGLSLSNQEAEAQNDKALSEWMYQRELIDIKRWYESMYRGLASADSDLKKLIDAPHRTELVVDPLSSPHDNGFGSPLQGSVDEMFTYAFKNRPEIRRSLYKIDKTEIENEKDIYRHLPGINLFVSANNDTNSFTLNQNYLAAGVNLSWDVIGLTKIGDVKRRGEARLSIEQSELKVVATTIMAQVALANEELKNLKEEVALAWKAKDVQYSITKKLESEVNSGKNREIYLIKEELLRELSILREDIARAELKAGEARLAQSLGVMKACQA